MTSVLKKVFFSGAWAAVSALSVMCLNLPSASADPIVQSPSTAQQCERVMTSNTTPEGFTPVGQAQRELCHRGIYKGPVDGINGPLTHEALTEYQKDKHLQVTGELNQQTAIALGLMTGAPGIQAGPGSGTA